MKPMPIEHLQFGVDSLMVALTIAALLYLRALRGSVEDIEDDVERYTD